MLRIFKNVYKYNSITISTETLRINANNNNNNFFQKFNLRQFCDKTPEKCDSNNVESKNADVILVDKDGPITIISLNRPECRNAINRVMAHDLCEAITDFENDGDAKIGVLHGIGGSFSSGYDMQELLFDNIKPEMLLQMEGSVGPTRRIIKKPMICGISGYCVANGLELALMCDLRVMEEDAYLGFYNRRFGIPLMDGGTIRLPVLIGLSRALDLILTGRTVTAKEAMDIGLINRIVATGTGLGQAVNLAYNLAKFPQATLNHDRKSVYTSAFESSTFDAAALNEIMSVSKDVIDEMIKGAELFKSGIGRTGKTENIKEKIMTHWEHSEYLKEKEYKQKQLLNAEFSKKN